MEKVEGFQESQWTAVDVWAALIEFDQHASRSENVDNVVSQLAAMIGRALSASEESELRRVLNEADPIMWELRIAGPSEDERTRVQREILRVLKPV